MKQSTNPLRVRRGAATVEFALVAPVFLTMILGVTEVSRMFEMQNQLQVAAREGARTGVMDRTGLTSAGQMVTDAGEPPLTRYARCVVDVQP